MQRTTTGCCHHHVISASQANSLWINLKQDSLPLRLFLTTTATTNNFIVKQYRLRTPSPFRPLGGGSFLTSHFSCPSCLVLLAVTKSPTYLTWEGKGGAVTCLPDLERRGESPYLPGMGEGFPYLLDLGGRVSTDYSLARDFTHPWTEWQTSEKTSPSLLLGTWSLIHLWKSFSRKIANYFKLNFVMQKPQLNNLPVWRK